MVLVATGLPVASTTATFTPVRKPGSRPMVGLAPAGAASSRSRRFAANTAERLGERAVSRPASLGHAELPRDHRLVFAAFALACDGAAGGRAVLRVQVEIEDLLLLAAEHRQDAV